jgi:putative nucleotidyltransferase with HDIG domain
LPKRLVIAIVAVVTTAILLFAGSVATWPIHSAIDDAALGRSGLVFWTLLTLIASSFPVQSSRGPVLSVSVAPILAAALLGGPTAAAIVAVLGTFDLRELRRQVPWYGTLYNHASSLIPAVIAGVVCEVAGVAGSSFSTVGSLFAALLAGVAYLGISECLAALVVALRQARSIRAVITADLKSYGLTLVGLAPLSWLMALAYTHIGPLVAVLFAVPLYTTRASYASVVEIRDMFTQTITALASAIDARDPSTKKHSAHVSDFAVETGQVLGLGEAELEQLRWGGLLHDIGKIGIRDAVLLKADRLDKNERALMNEHPSKGAEILKGVEKLSPEIPLILHHHQWFNGSGYPRVNEQGQPHPEGRALVGEEIPFLARILHVVDAFEAMTAARPYRPRPLSAAQAMAELRKYSGIQFDPRVVDAFAKTEASKGDLVTAVDEPVVATSIPDIREVAKRRANAPISTSSSAEVR